MYYLRQEFANPQPPEESGQCTQTGSETAPTHGVDGIAQQAEFPGADLNQTVSVHETKQAPNISNSRETPPQAADRLLLEDT